MTETRTQTMYQLRTYTIVPALPEPLSRLRELAYNLWWCWNSSAQEIFRRLNPDLWDDVVGNPAQFLAHVSQRRLDQAAQDAAYLAEMKRVLQVFDDYMARPSWFGKAHPDVSDARIAYFSMEFGLHESLPIYSGGLGILAGDHLKSASDLGLPLIGVGLLYRHGYFQQRLSTDGWQLEEYPAVDFYQIPATTVKENGGSPLKIRLPIGRREVTAQIWTVQVGRVPLYLLDTDLPENEPEDREITQRLYDGGGDEARIRQELLLGIGGLRALSALGIAPDVCHMNEGHAAFLGIERIRECMADKGLHFGEAREAMAAGGVFTTHTPVPAGIDQFDTKLLDKYLAPFLPSIGLTLDEFAALGKFNAADPNEKLSMAILALRLSGSANGVSALHGYVSRQLWHTVWPGAPRDEVPIISITNGIHTETWISPEMVRLLDEYLGPQRSQNPDDREVWRRVDEIPDVELWRVRERRRVALVAFARRRLKEQLRRRGAPPSEVKAAGEVLDPDALTIGFARRFAPYKRGALIFRDLDRLTKLLSNTDRPVQMIFAGKAHPRDDLGKEVIKQIISYIAKPEFRRRIVFIENYDITVARVLVQGVDVWLNNPIKPREASGTSGMKVVPNGGLNLSVLDGWWPEAYDGENGWAIEEGRVYDDPDYRDHIESEAIYELLEKEIVPLFYDRTDTDLPREWIAGMKASMRTISPAFSTSRMVKEYADRLYVPTARKYRHFADNGFQAAKTLSQWKRDLSLHWNKVRIEEVQANDAHELSVGAKVRVRARVHLAEVEPDEVAVELHHGRVNAYGELVEGSNEAMTCGEHLENGTYWFDGELPCLRSGQHGYAIRVLPRHPDLVHRFDTGLILWG